LSICLYDMERKHGRKQGFPLPSCIEHSPIRTSLVPDVDNTGKTHCGASKTDGPWVPVLQGHHGLRPGKDQFITETLLIVFTRLAD
jgi:hypothetical protein